MGLQAYESPENWEHRSWKCVVYTEAPVLQRVVTHPLQNVCGTVTVWQRKSVSETVPLRFWVEMGILSGTGLQAIGISFRQRTWLYFVHATRLWVKSTLNVMNLSIIPEISKNPSIQATLWILPVPFSQECRGDQVWKAEPKIGKTGMLARKDCASSMLEWVQAGLWLLRSPVGSRLPLLPFQYSVTAGPLWRPPRTLFSPGLEVYYCSHLF